MDIDDVVAKKNQFVSAKNERYSNFGIRDGSVWLSAVIEPAVDAGSDWVLANDYSLLARMDIYVFKDDVQTQYHQAGYETAGGPMPTRSLPTHLNLTPGQRHEIILRIRSEGSLIVPLALHNPNHFFKEDTNAHMLQGIFAGVSLCLIIYSLAHAIILRKGMYAAYAAYGIFMTLFVLSLQGYGSEYLWGQWPWMNKNASHLFVLLACGGQLWFFHDTLDVKILTPKLSIVLRIIRNTALAMAAALCLNIMSFRGAHLAATIVGQLGAVITIPILWYFIKSGKRAAWFILCGWVTYTVGALLLASTFNGTLHYESSVWIIFQLAALIEMVSWFVVLGIDAREKYQISIRLRAERNSMQNLAETDVLTGLPNRRALMTVLEKTLPLASEVAPSAVFMMDLDGFKAVNDTYGHQTGDDLLKVVAERLKHSLRGRDFVGRLGGDEFVVLTSIAHAEDAKFLAEKLITAIKVPVVIKDVTLSVGLTIGYAIAPYDGTTSKSLLDSADQALYQGKQGGKGQARRVTEKEARMSAVANSIS